jgi:hypothetical protein
MIARGSRRNGPLAAIVGTIAVAALSVLSAARATQPGRAYVAKAQRCGIVKVSGVTFRVGVVAGHTTCGTARSVVRYVLTHGRADQGSPGKAPRGWTCGYGYGRTATGDNVRGGPSCQHGHTIVEGIDASLHPYF